MHNEDFTLPKEDQQQRVYIRTEVRESGIGDGEVRRYKLTLEEEWFQRRALNNADKTTATGIWAMTTGRAGIAIAAAKV